MIKKFDLSTPSEGLISITRDIEAFVEDLRMDCGICLVYSPHTTAGITINENSDPDVIHDLLLGLDTAFPEDNRYLHAEGNSTAHLKASSIGSSVMVPVEHGKLVLGIWQDIYFCEFDGPRQRNYYCKLMAG